MAHEIELTSQDIEAFLHEVPENEVEGSDFSEFEDLSDVDIQSDRSSNSSDSDFEIECDIKASSIADILIAADGTEWKECNKNEPIAETDKKHDIKRERSGPTSHAKMNVEDGSVLTTWLLFIDKTILQIIKVCTEAEARRVLKDDLWSLTLDELQAFIAILYARGVSGAKGIGIHTLWSNQWGLNFCSDTMSRNRFLEIMKFLRFDFKSARPTRLKSDIFAMISEIWDKFIKNCVANFKPGENISIGEHLFASKTKCPFTQNIPSKNSQCGQKFWFAVDVETKYLLNAIPNFGESEQTLPSQRFPECVVMQLIKPFQNQGKNVIVDKFFTSVHLAEQLLRKETSLVGAISRTRREIPKTVKKFREKLYGSKILKHEETGATLTLYQGKRNKSVMILSSLHSNVEIEFNEKKIPGSVRYYNENKCGVDVIGQMASKYSVKAPSRRWPVHIFYNILDLAAINAWIVYNEVTAKNIPRRKFIQLLADEMRQSYISSQNKSQKHACTEGDSDDLPRKRKKCEIKLCNGNATNKHCMSCKKRVCGKCTAKTTYICKNCL